MDIADFGDDTGEVDLADARNGSKRVRDDLKLLLNGFVQNLDLFNIIVLEDGRVAEQGTHKRLLEKNGLYAHLWMEQNQAEPWQLRQK